MFIAHLPAGYLLTGTLIRSFQPTNITRQQYRALMLMGLLGSLLPDFDLLYFYFFDTRQYGHHSYWTHIPYFWTTLFLFCYTFCLMVNATRLVMAGLLILYFNIMLHLVLDTLVGGINWLHPINTLYLHFIEVPPRFNWWVWNFILHWTFALELLIATLALYKLTPAKISIFR